ncbi:MAG: lipopolysaccharide heptosyltransferase II [Deltaproteobacteria bacterium]|nr:lipopolysaccharide heptosyltransferase II [Deltaproteobacteria bacterium]
MGKQTYLKPIDASGIRRILVRITNWIGDTVMVLPALEAVKLNFPDSEITALVKPWVAPLFEHHPAVDRVLLFEKAERFPADLISLLKTAGKIRSMGFDLAVLFQNAFEAALLSRLGGVPLRVGYDTDGRGLLLTHPVSRKRTAPQGHQVEYYLAMLRAIGWEAPLKDPRLHVAPGSETSALRLFSLEEIEQEGFFLGIAPGAAFGPAKRWPPERFAALADQAVEQWGARVLIFGSATDRDLGREVKASMKNRAWNLCGETSLGEAVALIKRCRFFLTNDSGLMHVAAALEVPTVAIFGSTDPAATGPRGPHTRVVKKPTDCAPCLKAVCPKDFRCMLAIHPGDVWKVMEELRGEFQ